MAEQVRVNSVGTSFFGKGALSLLPRELQERNLKSPLIITDQFLFQSGAVELVTHVLDKVADLKYEVYSGVEPNPTIDVIENCLQYAKRMDADCLIAVGGGSSIDTSKAVGIVLANGGTVDQYEGVNKSRVRALPIVAVNTTAGTGSEVTAFYIVTNSKTHSKMVMIDTNCMVSIAINDADMMMSMPKSLTAATGMDAMTHAVEAILSQKATPLTDKDAMWAISTIKDYLPCAVADGHDVNVRDMMSYAEYTAGMAFSNSGLGMVHSMAHSLGGYYNLPHGVCNAVLLPYVLQFNGTDKSAQKKFKKIATALGIKGADWFVPYRAMLESISYIKKFSKSLGIPEKLSSFPKINPSDFPALADLALKDTCMPDNPVQPDKQDVIEVYKKAFKC